MRSTENIRKTIRKLSRNTNFSKLEQGEGENPMNKTSVSDMRLATMAKKLLTQSKYESMTQMDNAALAFCLNELTDRAVRGTLEKGAYDMVKDWVFVSGKTFEHHVDKVRESMEKKTEKLTEKEFLPR